MRQAVSFCRMGLMACAATLAVLTFVPDSSGKTDVPVFLLSGQSNMTGFCTITNDLKAEDREDVDNAKIYLEGQAQESKKGKWLTLGMGFDAWGNNLGPELSFGRTLSDSMPDTKIALIKSSVGGTYLGKSGEWLPPSSNGGNGGTLYNNMMGHIEAALRSFNSAFDTSEYVPQWAGFVWFQGEFDAQEMNYATAYEQNLTNLINDIRAHVEVEDLPVILPMIDAQDKWANHSIVRAADVTVSQNMENVDTVDTKDVPTDNTHYSAGGYITIGKLCAERWLAMDFDYGEIVPVIYSSKRREMRDQSLDHNLSGTFLFDLAGRRLTTSGGNALSRGALLQPRANGCVVIVKSPRTQGAAGSGSRGSSAGAYCNVR